MSGSGKDPQPSWLPRRNSRNSLLSTSGSFDTMDRSRHSTNSHGESSSSELIKELRAANAALTDKNAEVEAELMTQLSEMAKKIAEQEEELAEKKRIIAGWEKNYVLQIRDRDAKLTKLGKENATQKDQLLELKEQLFELQENCEEQEFEKHHWENMEKESKSRISALERENEELSEKVQTSEETIDKLRKELQDMILNDDKSQKSNKSERTARMESLEREYMVLQSKLETREATNKKLMEKNSALKQEVQQRESQLIAFEKGTKTDQEGEKNDDDIDYNNNGVSIEKLNYLEGENIRMHKENTIIRRELERLREELDNSELGTKLRNSETNAQLVDFERENSILFSRVSASEKDKEKLQNQLSDLKKKLGEDISREDSNQEREKTDIESKLVSMKEENLSLQKEVADLKVEIEEKYDELSRFGKEKQDLSEKISAIRKENTRLEEENSNFEDEVYNLEQKLENLTSVEKRENCDLSTRIGDLERENDLLRSKVVAVQEENSKLQDDIETLRTTTENNYKECEKHKDSLTRLDDLVLENKDLQSKILSSQEEITRLENEVCSLEEKLNDEAASAKHRNVESLSRIDILEEENQDLQSKFTASQEEIERLEDEVYVLEQKLEANIASTKQKEMELSKIDEIELEKTELHSELESLREENINLLDEVTELKSKLNDDAEREMGFAAKVENLESENKKLYSDVTELRTSNETLQDEVYEIEQNLNNVTEAAKRGDCELSARIDDLQHEKIILQSKLDLSEEENVSLQEQVVDLKKQLNKLEIERESLDMLHDLEKENEDLVSKATAAQNETIVLREEIEDIKEKAELDIAAAKKRDCELSARIDDLEHEKNKLLSEVEATQQKNACFHDEINSLKTKLQEEDLLAKVDGLEQDNKILQSKTKLLQASNDKLTEENGDLRERLEKANVESLQNVACGNVLQSWKELEKTKKILADTKKRLHESQSAFAALDQENKRIEKQHVLTQASLRKEIADCQAEKSKLVEEFTHQIKSLESESGIEKTQAKLKEKESKVKSLEENINLFEKRVQKLQSEIEETRVEKEKDSRCSAEEIERLLQKNCNQQEEIYILKESLNNTKKILEERSIRNEALSTEIASLRERLSSSEAGYMRLSQLNSQLDESQAMIAMLKDDIHHTIQKKNLMESEYKDRISSVEKEKDVSMNKLEAEIREQFQKTLENQKEELEIEMAKQQVKMSQEIDQYHKKTKEMEAAFESKIQEKVEMITNLEQTVDDQKQIIGRLKEEISLLEIKSQHELKVSQEETDQKSIALGILETQVQDNDKIIARSSKTISELKQNIQCLEKEISELQLSSQREIKEMEEKANKESREVCLLKTAIREKDEILIKYEESIEDQKQKIESLLEEISMLKFQSQELRQCQEELNNKNAALHDLELKIREKENAIITFEDSIDKLKQEVECQKQEISNLRIKSEQELNEFTLVNKECNDEITKNKAKKQELQAKLDECTGIKESLLLETKTLRNKVNVLEKEVTNVAELKQELAEARFALESLAIEKKFLEQSQNGEVGALQTELEEAKKKWSENEEKLRKEVNNVSELSRQLEKSQDALGALEAEKERILQGSHRDMNALSVELDEMREKLSDKEKSLKERISHASKISKELSEAQVVRKTLKTEKERIGQRNEQLVNSLRIELDDFKKKYSEKENSLREQMTTLERENMVMKDKLNDREKQLTSSENDVALREKKETKMRVELDLLTTRWKEESFKNKEEIKRLRKELNSSSSRIAEQTQVIDSLKATLQRREELLEELQSSVMTMQKNRSLPSNNEEKLRREIDSISAAKEVVETQLKNQLLIRENENKAAVEELRSKLYDRNITISALVKSSVVLERRMSCLQKDNEMLQSKLTEKSSEDGNEVNRLKQEVETNAALAAEKTAETEVLKRELKEFKERESKLDQEIATLREKAVSTEIQTGERISELESFLRITHEKSVKNQMESIEISALKKKIEELKERESNLSAEVALLRKEAGLSEIEAARKISELRSQLESACENGDVQKLRNQLEEQQSKLWEKDTKLKSLVARSVTQEQQIASLKAEIEGMKADRSQPTASLEEIQRIQQESEIFAGQIIEQDEEISRLNAMLGERERVNTSLTNEIRELRKKLNSSEKDSSTLFEVKAHLDELQSINTTQRTELRELKQRLREADTESISCVELKAELDVAHSTIEALKEEITKCKKDEIIEADLRHNLKEANTSKEILKSKLDRLEKRLRDVKHTEDDLRKQVDELKGSKKAILEDLKQKEEVIVSEEKKVASLKTELNKSQKNVEKKSAWSLTRESKKMEKASAEIESLQITNSTLKEELGELKEKLHSLQKEADRAPQLEAKLEESDNERASFEEKVLANFERKLSLIKMEKDITIDKLRKELADAKKSKSEIESALTSQISSLELSNKALETELEAKLQRKNAKILALEQKLSAQQQVVGHMRQEMDQLQSSMEKATMMRRAEIEEMQQEVIDSSTRATRQEQEISKLKMVLEERKARHKAEVTKLYDKIAALEKDSPLSRGIQTQRDDRKIEELNETIQKLKWRNTSLAEDCQKMRERIEKYEREAKTSSKNDKWRNSALSEQVKILTKRIKELESSASSSTKPKGTSYKGRFSQNLPMEVVSPRNVSEYPSPKEEPSSSLSRDDISTTTKFTF